MKIREICNMDYSVQYVAAKPLDIDKVVKLFDDTIAQTECWFEETTGYEDTPFNVALYCLSMFRGYHSMFKFDKDNEAVEKLGIANDPKLPLLKFMGLVGYNIDVAMEDISDNVMIHVVDYIRIIYAISKDLELLVTGADDEDLVIERINENCRNANSLFPMIVSGYKAYYMLSINKDPEGISFIGICIDESNPDINQEDFFNTDLNCISDDDLYVII